MFKSVAHIQTEFPERLMNRLCKHWGHKFPVAFGERQATIELPLGACCMQCADGLTVALDSDDEQMPKLQQVVADHLRRMAGKEQLVIEWH